MWRTALRTATRHAVTPLVSVPRIASRSFTTSLPSLRNADGFVNMITVDEERPMVVVASLTPLAGFTLGDGLILPSPILVINNLVYMWDVGPPSEDGKWEGFEEEALKVFEVITPRPEILLVGTGARGLFPPPHFKQYLNGLGIQVDVLDSRNAGSTYNLLAEEGRRVACALYPLTALSARTGSISS